MIIRIDNMTEIIIILSYCYTYCIDYFINISINVYS